MKTVYVVGAGASCDVGLPIGEDLKQQISKLLDIKFEELNSYDNGDMEIFNALIHVRGNNPIFSNYQDYDIQDLCWNVSENLPLAISIDNYIDNHSDKKEIEIIGKLAILRAISIAESKSKISLEKNQKFSSKFHLNTWYVKFFQSITENCQFEKVGEILKDITLIIFNYDRCVEQFLFQAFLSFYGRSQTEVKELLSNLTIIHPYGKLGELPYQDPINGTKFGHAYSSKDLVKNLKNIKTFTEGMSNDSESQDRIRNRMASAERLVFLGFAFHELNMELLTPTNKSDLDLVECFATTYGMSDNDISIVETMVRNLYEYPSHKTQIKFSSAEKKCFEFFNHFRLSLRYT